MRGLAFDAGGLIALERADRRVLLLLDDAVRTGRRIVIPATVLAQTLRNPARQVRLWRMIQSERSEIVPLDFRDAQSVGCLLAQTGTTDVCDAHVVVCAQEAGLVIVTSDPLDMRRLDSSLQLAVV